MNQYLYRDKSFIIRKIQVEKSKQLFKVYPFLGVELKKFTEYRLDIEYNDSFFKVQRPGGLKSNLDERSAHNSHYAILYEVGIFGF